MIYYVGDYLCLKNESFKFEVDPHHFNTKSLVMLGFMDLRRPRIAQHSNIGLVEGAISLYKLYWIENGTLVSVVTSF